MYEMELIEANPDPTKSAVMSRAAELVNEGYDRSSAVSQAWDDILDEDEEDEPYEFDEMLQNKSTRRNTTMENPLEEAGIGTLAMVGAGFYLLWCAIAYKKNGIWSWTPWRTPAPISRRIASAQAPRRIGYDPIPDNNRGAEYVTLIVP